MLILRKAILPAAVWAASVPPAPAAAQTVVSFTIADSLTSRGIEGALLELATPDGRTLWSGHSGMSGAAMMRIPPGATVIRAEMVAYQPAGPVTVTIPARDSVFIRILLSPAPLAVDSLEVTSRRRGTPGRRERWGFDWRRVNRPFGTFYDRSELDGLAAHSVSSLMRRMTGVRIVQSPFGSAQVYMRTDQFLDKWGGSMACGPAVYRDGMLLHEGGRGDPAPIDDLVRMSEIVALEIYRSGGEVPVEFEPDGIGACGAIVIWTR